MLSCKSHRHRLRHYERFRCDKRALRIALLVGLLVSLFVNVLQFLHGVTLLAPTAAQHSYDSGKDRDFLRSWANRGNIARNIRGNRYATETSLPVVKVRRRSYAGLRSDFENSGSSQTTISKNLNSDEKIDGEFCGDILRELAIGVECKTYYDGIVPQCCCKNTNDMLICLPSVIIIGAQKSGSTVVAATLMQHSQYKHARYKELHFFDRKKNYGAGVKKYLQSFNPVDAGQIRSVIVGETTPSYMIDFHAPFRIHHYLPKSKFIVVLRNPVDRAYSEYQMEVRRISMQSSFIQILIRHLPEYVACLKNRRMENAYHNRRYDECIPVVIEDIQSMHSHMLKDLSRKIVKQEEVLDCLNGFGTLNVTEKEIMSCFQPQGIFMEELNDVNRTFQKEMTAIYACRNEAGRMAIGTSSCYPNGATSTIMKDFLFRSCYGTLLRHWLQFFPLSQFLIIAGEHFRRQPSLVFDSVERFLTIKETKITFNESKIHHFINQKFPRFEEATGWKMNGDYEQMDAKLRQQLVTVCYKLCFHRYTSMYIFTSCLFFFTPCL